MLDAPRDIRARRLLTAYVLCTAALSACMILIGLLLTKSLTHLWPLTVEDGVDRFFAAHRDPYANAVTDALCTAADTFGAAAAALIAVGWARWRCGRWREPLFLAFSALLELAVFLITTAAVHRPRPAVPELDASPPTSSFPSGHTAAALALYGAVALLICRRTGRNTSWLLLLVPGAVGVARLYRGMHHPSDVLAGVLLGALSIWAADRCVLRGEARARVAPSPAQAQTIGAQTASRHAPDVLIVNGAKADDATVADLLERYSAQCARDRRPVPRVATTTPDEHGAGLAASAVRAGASLIVACGGDGTINEVAGALAGTDVVLGVVPMGTGNLVAANLGIPTGIEDALATLADGVDRRIDVGRVDGRIFLGMAGMGLDAAMIEDAPAGLKRHAGWAAYAVAVVRHLSDRVPAVSVTVDGRRTRYREVGMLLVGNVGRLQAGLVPLPDARPDDGLLDLAAVSPRGPFGWLRVAAALHRRRIAGADQAVFRDQGRRISIRTHHPAPCEADGEPLAPAARMDVEVWPGALRVRVPREAADVARVAPAAAAEGRQEATR